MANFHFDHIHLLSSDPEKTAKFYETLLGAKRMSTTSIRDKGMLVELKLGEMSVKIMTLREKSLISASPMVGIEHFGIETDNIEEAVNEMKARGIDFAVDITEPRPGLKNAFFVAPEGVLIELSETSAQFHSKLTQ